MAGQMVCCLSWLGMVSELFEGPLYGIISRLGVLETLTGHSMSHVDFNEW